MGPSEFESESLAPQARRMVQATPRPHRVYRGPPTRAGEITVAPEHASADEEPRRDARDGDDGGVGERQPEERPEVGDAVLRRDLRTGGRASGRRRVGGLPRSRGLRHRSPTRREDTYAFGST